MAQLPYQPQNLQAEQSDGNILLTWTASLGATGYQVLRSTDGVNFTTLATVGQVNTYIDKLPGVGTMFYYAVAATNTAGTGPVSTQTQMVAAPPSEMSLFELRLRSQQAADRVGNDFVTQSEWNAMLRLSCYELYDLLLASYDDLYSNASVTISTNGSLSGYPLPDGCSNYLGGVYGGTSGTPAPALYKLAGVDLSVNQSPVNPARITVKKYDFIERNDFVYPNSNSSIYGVSNMRYRMMGPNISFVPNPSSGQSVILWYAPKLTGLLADTDITTIGFSGWLRYVIVRASKYALDKEEGSDTSKQDAELLFLKTRIEQMAQNRDIGQADTISATRQDSIWGGGSNGPNGGW